MKKGHCLCGVVRWQYSGKETWACYCHCKDCTRNCAAPVTAFIGVELKSFEWTNGEPRFYRSTAGVKRFFCENCGTPMAFQAEHYAGEIHLYAATLENPEEFKPEFHVHTDRQLSWLELTDELPRFDGSKT